METYAAELERETESINRDTERLEAEIKKNKAEIAEFETAFPVLVRLHKRFGGYASGVSRNLLGGMGALGFIISSAAATAMQAPDRVAAVEAAATTVALAAAINFIRQLAISQMMMRMDTYDLARSLDGESMVPMRKLWTEQLYVGGRMRIVLSSRWEDAQIIAVALAIVLSIVAFATIVF